MGGDYTAWAAAGPDDAREHYTGLLLDLLPQGARVLDLGCGGGLPTTRALAERSWVVGVDLSWSQVASAQANVPGVAFVQGDMGSVAFRPGSFHGVAVFYSLIHLPRDEQPPLLARIAEWLRPGGMLVVTMGVSDMAAATDGFFGAAMFWSGYDAASNEQMVADAGFDVISATVHTVNEFGVQVPFLWVHAQKPCAS